MKPYSTAERLQSIMTTRNLKQIDILNLSAPYCKKFNIKLNRNDLSQYVNGKVVPGQFKLTVIAMALNVSEAWLMGYDVPIEREVTLSKTNHSISLDEDQQNALSLYSQLDTIDRAEIRGMMKQMLKASKYAGKNSKMA